MDFQQIHTCRTMTHASLNPGDLIADRYKVDSLIGSGGHANVYLATQEKLGRKVALKVLKTSSSSASQHDILARRFEQEAKLISQLRDPHTITMYDYGNTTDGLLYMVCEYVEGESLKDIFIREGKLAPKRVSAILEQLLQSLQEAHAYGVLHRDIKPDNIMIYTHLGRHDQVKLLDFGIAKIAMGDGSENDITAEGSLVGTPRYIAPERIRGEILGPASDIYSLGLVAYEALTGKRVMEGLHGVRALQAQLGDPSIRLPDDPSIPSELKTIVERMIEKDIALRYSATGQILQDLKNAPTPAPQPSSPPPKQSTPPVRDLTEKLDAKRSTYSAQPSSTTPPNARKAPKRASKKAPSNTLMILIIAALIFAILLAIGVLVFLMFVYR
mgnify:CR=1 FL=1